MDAKFNSLSESISKQLNELYFDKSGFCIVSKTSGILLACQNGRNKERGLNQFQRDKNIKPFKIMQLFSLSCFHFNLQLELLKIRVIFTAQHYSAWCNYLLSIMIGNNDSWRIQQNIEYNYPPLSIMIGSNDSWIIQQNRIEQMALA